MQEPDEIKREAEESPRKSSVTSLFLGHQDVSSAWQTMITMSTMGQNKSFLSYVVSVNYSVTVMKCLAQAT